MIGALLIFLCALTLHAYFFFHQMFLPYVTGGVFFLFFAFWGYIIIMLNSMILKRLYKVEEPKKRLLNQKLQSLAEISSHLYSQSYRMNDFDQKKPLIHYLTIGFLLSWYGIIPLFIYVLFTCYVNKAYFKGIATGDTSVIEGLFEGPKDNTPTNNYDD